MYVSLLYIHYGRNCSAISAKSYVTGSHRTDSRIYTKLADAFFSYYIIIMIMIRGLPSQRQRDLGHPSLSALPRAPIRPLRPSPPSPQMAPPFVPAALALLLLPPLLLLLWVLRLVLGSHLALRRPHHRALPRAPRGPAALPPALHPLLGAGDWGLVASARGLSARASVAALVAARRACGGVFLSRTAFGRPAVIVMEGEALRRIMFAAPYSYVKAENSRRLLGPLIGWEGLVLAEGEKHRRMRGKVGKAMHHEAVAEFSAMFLEEAEKLRAFLGDGKGGEGGGMMMEGVGAATCRTIVRSFFPEEVLSSERMERVLVLYRAVLKDLGNVVREFVVTSVLWFLPSVWITRGAGEKRGIRDEADAMLADATRLHAAREGRGEGRARGLKSMVGYFLEEKGAQLTRREQTDNLLTFLAAGQITTAVSLEYALWRLAKHPAWQARVRAELDACAAWRDDALPPAARVEAVCGLPVLARVLKESLRLYPPVSLSARVLAERDELCGHRLEPGTMIAIPIQAIHCDEDVWEDPWTFDPDRFLPEREAGRDKMAWIPFLYGPRGCIGQRFALREMAVLCAEVVYSFELSVDPLAKEFVPKVVGISPHPDVVVHARPRRTIAKASVNAG